jgi:hypothetical protein
VHRRALFVETDPGKDLTGAPFLYQVQADAARRLVAVPYQLLSELAYEVPLDPSRLILVYSTGRCGSTLVSHAFGAVPGVLSLSEPDVFTQLVALRRKEGSDIAEIRSLIRSTTLLQCAAAARHAGSDRCMLKFRSFVTGIADVFYEVFPDAKIVFLYRQAEGYFRSIARYFGPEMAEHLTEPFPPIQEAFRPLDPLVDAYSAARTEPLSPVGTVTCLWASVMRGALALQGRGIPLFSARYEELKTDPRAVLSALFAFCGIAAGDDVDLDSVLARDSQEGTGLSRETMGRSAPPIPASTFEALHRFLAEWAPELSPDTRIPGTFTLPTG